MRPTPATTRLWRLFWRTRGIFSSSCLRTRATSSVNAEGEKNILVRVIHAGGGEAAFPIQTRQDYLGFALVEAGVVEDNQSTYGLYILTADGETADEGNQEWWKVTKSGEMVNTGADQTPIADGDAFELTLTVGYDG